MKKLKTLDLFAGCGGLCEGFEQSRLYSVLGAVEWEKAPRETLAHRLESKWGVKDAQQKTLLFDIQRTDELFSGWINDDNYGSGIGLDSVLNGTDLDVVVGGPPCQAYSLAGRIRDKDGMRYDYRNYLFDCYVKVIKKYEPKAFVFENVPGLLSARPDGEPVAPKIIKAFNDVGWIIPENLKTTLVDMSEFGLPQVRKRLIIIGLSKKVYGNKISGMLEDFYTRILPSKKVLKKVSAFEAIGDLPKLYPLKNPSKKEGSHSLPDELFCPSDHEPRYHNKRDIEIFRELASDAKGENLYSSTQKLKELYTKKTGKESAIHKYHVIRENEPSNLIPAHLMKDGLRHIHPDPQQARSITVREAARLQGFPDDFEFIGTQGQKYKMIGNAVPPLFAKIVAECLYELLENNQS